MKLIALIIAAFILAAGAFVLSDFSSKKNTNPKHATTYSKPQDLPEFSLTDSNNLSFNNNSLKDRWTLVFFGYTRCPDVCPTELFMLTKVLKKLETKNIKLPQVVFISLDPQRDTTSELKKYTAYFHENIMGITGKQSEIDMLAKKMGVIYEKVYEKDGEYVVIENNNIPDEMRNSYTVNHSAGINIIDPEGNFFGVFGTPHDADKIASDMAQLQSNS